MASHRYRRLAFVLGNAFCKRFGRREERVRVAAHHGCILEGAAVRLKLQRKMGQFFLNYFFCDWLFEDRASATE